MPSTRLAPGDLVRIRDERWLVARHTVGVGAEVLEVRGRDRANLGTRASFLLPFEIVEPLPVPHAPRLVRARRWRRRTRALLAEATPSWHALRTPLHARISLLPFQLEPALAVTHGVAARLLIADEVGLGKTIQAGLVIAEILTRSRRGRVLVVAPASLKEQWHSELHSRFGLDAWLADRASLAQLGSTWTASANPWIAHAVTITSIDYIKRPEVVRPLEALVWDAVVFDEAHALAGRSDRAEAAKALACRARTVVMLTATPHTGDDRVFRHLCGTGDLDGEFPLLVFRRTRHDVGLSVSRRTISLAVRPTLAEREMHSALMTYARRVWKHSGPSVGAAQLAMTVLTRRACSSAAALARSVERRLALMAGAEPTGAGQLALAFRDTAEDDEEPGVELSAPGLDDREEERRQLRHILGLAERAASNESKLRALARLLRRAREPAIVFTEYRDTLTRIAEAFHDLDPVTLHGGLTAPERRDSLRRFTTGNARLLIATDAASEGLNLQQRCRLVINLELPWTPLRLEQRIGRVERIGQAKRVHVVHLLAAGSTEESSVAALLTRIERVNAVLGLLRPRATEQQVASVAIGGNALEDSAHPHEGATPDLLVASLQTEAKAEADRLGRARDLVGGARDAEIDARAQVTVSRRRPGTDGALWGFRLAFLDADEQLVWETLLGLKTMAPRGCPDAVREWLASREHLLSQTVETEHQRALAVLAASLQTPLALASRRERAIADALTRERARLSAALLQPGLFDRRAERTLAAQTAVTHEALARCRIRMEELASTARLLVERPRLAFAVIRR